MPTITALILTRFREGAKKVASWLTKKSYESLFLDLPKELEKFLSVHIEGEAFVEDLWRSYSYLTGFQEPFINAMRYTVDPILDALAQFRSRLHELKVYCYQDLEYYMEARKLSERLLILENAYTVKPKVFLGRKIFRAISDVVRLAGGHYFCAGKAGRFIIPKKPQQNNKES